ncbi:MAG TPA: hypothetical protein VNU25_01865 [Candidatus Paceibacterota bacterium]|nr:hypothetical protein [Candidatus Paceibacterota bacterium]
MTNVSFNEEQTIKRTAPVQRDPLFVRLLIGWGIVHTRRAAEVLLIAIALLSLIAAAWLFPKGRGEPELDVPMAGPESTRLR